MGKGFLMSSQNAAVNSGEKGNFFGTGDFNATESATQYSATEAVTFRRLARKILSGGSGSNTAQFRVNGANGNLVVTRSGTGTVEDNTNTDTLSAGDTFNIAYTDTGTSPDDSYIRVLVEFSSGHGCFHSCANYAGRIYDLASTTTYIGFSGTIAADGTATEANVAFRNRAYSSMEALQVRVTANARTNDTTVKNRINAADGTASITIGAGLTGLFTATSIGDSLSSGDDFCASITLGTGVEDLTISMVGCTCKSTSNKSETWGASTGGNTRAASATATYYTIGGNATSGTQTDVAVPVGFAGVASNLRIYLSANTYTGNSTLKLMKNGTAVITLTIASGATGWQENSTDSVLFDGDDTLSFEIDSGTSGSITFHMFGITLFDPWTAGGLHHITQGMGDVGLGGGGGIPQTLHTIERGIAA